MNQTTRRGNFMTTSKRDALAEEYKEKCFREAMTAVPQFISIDEAYKSVANSVIDYKAGWDAREPEIAELKTRIQELEMNCSAFEEGSEDAHEETRLARNEASAAREEARALREALEDERERSKKLVEALRLAQNELEHLPGCSEYDIGIPDRPCPKCVCNAAIYDYTRDAGKGAE